MVKLLMAALAVFILQCLISTPSRADIRGDMAAGLPLEQVFENSLAGDSSTEGIKAAMTSMIVAGADELDVVEAAFKAGIAPETVTQCAIIQCALEAGCDVREVVWAALAFGLAPEFIADCCHKYGADPHVVASAIASWVADGGSLSGYGDGYGQVRYLGSIPAGGGGGGGADLSPNQ